jgi:hypothetical protein
MDRLFFLHIPKTGGSSLISALAKKFANWEVFPWRHVGLDLYNQADLMRYRFYPGHFTIGDLDFVPKPAQSLTLLREPKSRIVSLYHFWRSHRTERFPPNEPHPSWIAKSAGLQTFLTLQNPTVRGAVDNALVQAYLRYPLRGRNNALTAAPETILDDALAALDSLSVFGILERFDDSVAAIGGELGSRLVLPAARVRSFDLLESDRAHERIERQLPTSEVEDLLDSLTELDRAFYQRALPLFEAKFARHFGAESREGSNPGRRKTAYEWGDWVNFGGDAHLDGVDMSGWSDREPWGVWSVDARPSLRIGPLPPSAGGIQLTFSVRAAVFATHPEQVVTVLHDGRPIDSWVFTWNEGSEQPTQILTLPASAVNDQGYLELAFEVRRPISLLEVGISADARELGIGLENIHIECAVRPGN